MRMTDQAARVGYSRYDAAQVLFEHFDRGGVCSLKVLAKSARGRTCGGDGPGLSVRKRDRATEQKCGK